MGVLGWGVVAAAGGFLYTVSRRPSAFEVTRSAQLAADPDTVFGLVNDFHRWREWSPWEELDPGMERRFGGLEAGVGASYSWSGNRKAGAGTMTITESEPGRRIVIELEFTRPMVATHQVEFLFEPKEGGVEVTWSMRGEHSFMGKAVAVFVNTDKMVGKSFEQGLRNLERTANGEPANAPADVHQLEAKP